jgi:hypothetical protein
MDDAVGYGYSCNVSIDYGSCSLNKSFYTLFAICGGSVAIFTVLLSVLTYNNTVTVLKLVGMINTNLLCYLNNNALLFKNYGFLRYCDWMRNGRSYCCGSLEFSAEQGFENELDKVEHLKSYCTVDGFYKLKEIYPNRVLVDFNFRDFNYNAVEILNPNSEIRLMKCLKLILDGQKITKGNHLLSIKELIDSCKGDKILKFDYSEKYLYGEENIMSFALLHNELYFGAKIIRALDSAVKGLHINPLPFRIKNTEWKVYCSDVMHHMGFSRLSKCRKFNPSRSLSKMMEDRGLKDLKSIKKDKFKVEEITLSKEERNENAVLEAKFLISGSSHQPVKEPIAHARSYITDVEVLNTKIRENKQPVQITNSMNGVKPPLTYSRVCKNGLISSEYKTLKEACNRITDFDSVQLGIDFLKRTLKERFKEEIRLSDAPKVRSRRGPDRVALENERVRIRRNKEVIKSFIDSANEVKERNKNRFYIDPIFIKNLYLSSKEENGSVIPYLYKELAEQELNEEKFKECWEEVEEGVTKDPTALRIKISSFVSKPKIHFKKGKKKKKVKNNCNKRGSWVKNIIGRSNLKTWFSEASPGKFKIFDESKAVRALLKEDLLKRLKSKTHASSNNMEFLGVSYKRWGLRNKVLSYIYKKCFKKVNSGCDDECQIRMCAHYRSAYCYTSTIVNWIRKNYANDIDKINTFCLPDFETYFMIEMRKCNLKIDFESFKNILMEIL